MLIAIHTDDAPVTTTRWEVFVRDNDEAFSAAELDEMETRLAAGETVTLGGGAAPLFTLTRAD